MTAFSYYGNKIRAEFQDPNYKAQKYVLLSDMDNYKLALFQISTFITLIYEERNLH